MPIVWLLGREHHAFGPEEIRTLTAAFEDALRSLRMDRTAPEAVAVAKRIIELARLGELDPVRLRDYAIEIGRPPRVE
jgi:hypothetical protein